MLRRYLFVFVSAMLLAACGRGSEDFTVTVARPVAKVSSSFDHASLDGDIASLFPGMHVARTTPEPGSVLYTIPGDGDFPAAIKLTFESVDSGKGTVIHAAIDVPRTEVNYGGKAMEISESKVEWMIRGLLRSAASKLEEGRTIEEEQRDFSRLLTVLAIITDSKKLRLAQDISKYPEWYLTGLGWLSGMGDGPANPYGDYAGGEDPGMAARQDEVSQHMQEREDQAKAAENAAPMDDAHGDSAAGDSGY